MLANLIQQHAAESAAAGDWEGVAATLNAEAIVHRDTTPLTYSRISTLFGDESRQLVAGTLRAIAGSNSPLAGEIKDAHELMLWSHEGIDISTDVRQATIDQIATAGQWPEALRDAIKRLGKQMVSIAQQADIGEVTAEQCAAAYLVGADVLLSVNRRDGQSKICLQVFRDGQLVRIATLVESEGSLNDRELIASVESAIDTWLLAGG